MGTIINVSICLSDLPKEAITLYEKNGKKYINLVVDEKKEPDQYGKTHSVYVSQSKEEREAKTPKTYVGHGKAVNFNANGQSGISMPNVEKAPQNASNEFADDMPF